MIEELVVDTGPEFTWIPESVLKEIGVEVEKPNQHFVMANGEVITRDIGYAIIKVIGFETVDEIVFAHGGDLSLLGSRTLEGFGATEPVDPEIDAGIEMGLALPGDLGVAQGKAAAEAGDQVLAGHTLVRE